MGGQPGSMRPTAWPDRRHARHFNRCWLTPGCKRPSTKAGEEEMLLGRFPIAVAATTLALSLAVHASPAVDGQLSQAADQLMTALEGDPVQFSERVVSVTLTSGADAMFPSGGWQIPSDAPLLNKMLPMLSKLRNRGRRTICAKSYAKP